MKTKQDDYNLEERDCGLNSKMQKQARGDVRLS